MPELWKQAAVWKASPGHSKSSEWRQGGFIAQRMRIRAPQRADIPFDCLSRRAGFLPLRLFSVFPLDANGKSSPAAESFHLSWTCRNRYLLEPEPYELALAFSRPGCRIKAHQRLGFALEYTESNPALNRFAGAEQALQFRFGQHQSRRLIGLALCRESEKLPCLSRSYRVALASRSPRRHLESHTRKDIFQVAFRRSIGRACRLDTLPGLLAAHHLEKEDSRITGLSAALDHGLHPGADGCRAERGVAWYLRLQ